MHVESILIPCLDQGSIPCCSTTNADYQYFTKTTPNFTPGFVKLGVF